MGSKRREDDDDDEGEVLLLLLLKRLGSEIEDEGAAEDAREPIGSEKNDLALEKMSGLESFRIVEEDNGSLIPSPSPSLASRSSASRCIREYSGAIPFVACDMSSTISGLTCFPPSAPAK